MKDEDEIFNMEIEDRVDYLLTLMEKFGLDSPTEQFESYGDIERYVGRLSLSGRHSTP